MGNLTNQEINKQIPIMFYERINENINNKREKEKLLELLTNYRSDLVIKRTEQCHHIFIKEATTNDFKCLECGCTYNKGEDNYFHLKVYHENDSKKRKVYIGNYFIINDITFANNLDFNTHILLWKSIKEKNVLRSPNKQLMLFKKLVREEQAITFKKFKK